MIFALLSILASSMGRPHAGSVIVRGDSANWAEIATAVIALLALIGAFIQLWSARVATRRRTAFGYFERWSDPGAVKYIAEMASLLVTNKDGLSDQKRFSEWFAGDHEAKLTSLLFVNFWEELGGLYNRKLVDREVIRQYLGAPIVAYWDDAQWFVKCGAQHINIDKGSGALRADDKHEGSGASRADEEQKGSGASHAVEEREAPGASHVDAQPEDSGPSHTYEEWRKMSEDVRRWLKERDKPTRRRRARMWFARKVLGWL